MRQSIVRRHCLCFFYFKTNEREENYCIDTTCATGLFHQFLSKPELNVGQRLEVGARILNKNIKNVCNFLKNVEYIIKNNRKERVIYYNKSRYSGYVQTKLSCRANILVNHSLRDDNLTQTQIY